MRTKLLQTLVLGVATGVVSCGSGDDLIFDGGVVPNTGLGGGTSVTGGGSASASGSGASAGNKSTGSTGTLTGKPKATGGSGSVSTGSTATKGGGESTGESSCVQGVDTGSKCNPSVDTTECVRSTRTCTCEDSGQWTCVRGSGPGGGTSVGGATSVDGTATGGKSPTDTAAVNCSGTPLTGGKTYERDGSGAVAGGYHYELWHDGGGSMKMTVYDAGAAFKADWNNAGDFLARVGLKWDETKTYDQYGTVAADYAFTKTGDGGGYSFIGIYGWSTGPLIEYYIVDDWFGQNPPTGGGTLKGSFEVDGGKYNIYTFTRVNMPSIKGTSTFEQFFSVRQKARQCGHISITAHFDKWKELGLKLGKMYEAKILVEAGGGKGTFDLTSATLTATK